MAAQAVSTGLQLTSCVCYIFMLEAASGLGFRWQRRCLGSHVSIASCAADITPCHAHAVQEFMSDNYLGNWVQSLFNALGAEVNGKVGDVKGGLCSGPSPVLHEVTHPLSRCCRCLASVVMAATLGRRLRRSSSSWLRAMASPRSACASCKTLSASDPVASSRGQRQFTMHVILNSYGSLLSSCAGRCGPQRAYGHPCHVCAYSPSQVVW